MSSNKFTVKPSKNAAPASSSNLDMSVRIADLLMPNPVGVASGTYGYGSEYEEFLPLGALGALYTKAVTKDPRPGNDIPRIVETPGGLLNSIGLANVGSIAFARDKYPMLKDADCPVIINVAGSFEDDYAETLAYLEEHAPLHGYEINVSCPNVKCGGMALGTDPALVEGLTKRLRALTKRPIIVKLSPNVTDIAGIAMAAEAGGADAVSCINTLVGMLIDTKAKKPVLATTTGGLSGPAVLPVGLAATWKVSRAVSIPVIGMGGITEPDHAVQYLLAGASAFQLGTINFVDPAMPTKVMKYLSEWMQTNKVYRVEEIRNLMGNKPLAIKTLR